MWPVKASENYDVHEIDTEHIERPVGRLGLGGRRLRRFIVGPVTAELGISDGRALGTGLRLITTRPEAIERSRAAVDALLASVDLACSRFRDDSELQAVNRAGGREVTLSPLLNKAVERAMWAARWTEGAVDPTVGTAIRLAGYDRDFADLAPSDEPLLLVAHRVPGWQLVQHSASSGRLRIGEGVELDLGATAKALASDLAAEAALDAAGGGGVLVSLGGDIAVAGEAPDGGWAIQVSDDSEAPLAAGEETIVIMSGAVATSSTTVRRWTRGSIELHHIIDPRTGLPAHSPWRTASVVARTCVEANAASTAAIVLGDAAPRWLGERGVAARLVGQDRRITRLGGWPEPPLAG